MWKSAKTDMICFLYCYTLIKIDNYHWDVWLEVSSNKFYTVKCGINLPDREFSRSFLSVQAKIVHWQQERRLADPIGAGAFLRWFVYEDVSSISHRSTSLHSCSLRLHRTEPAIGNVRATSKLKEHSSKILRTILTHMISFHVQFDVNICDSM